MRPWPFLFLLLWSTSSAAALPAPSVGPTPAWVEPLELPTLGAPPDAPVRTVLSERQLRVTAKSFHEYVHYALQPLTSTGVDEVARIDLEFEPTYEQVTVHGVWRHRNGAKASLYVPEDVQVIHAEGQLEQRLYDGRLTAILELRQVQVGDVIEVAYTLTGRNPVHRGHYADVHATRREHPIDRLGFRLLYDDPRPLRVVAHNGAELPVAAQREGLTEYRIVSDGVPALSIDDDLPADHDPYPAVEFSNWGSWADVARWADTLFTLDAGSPRLSAEVARLKALPADAGLPEAVRFVQDDVRYLGIELGIHSHQPHAPDWLLERGFGDCKDKALLLVALARQLGYEAWPALVHTSDRTLAARLPAGELFNHAIAVIRVDGHDAWIDATAALERGPLLSRTAGRYERALVVRPDATELTIIPAVPLDEPTWDVEQAWTIAQATGPATVRFTTTLRGADANQQRVELASRPKSAIARSYYDWRKELLPTLAADGGLSWKDDAERNVLVLEERYSVPGPLEVERLITSRVGDFMSHAGGDRRSPLFVEHPRYVRERVTVEAPGPLRPHTTAPLHLEGPAYRFDFAGKVDGARLELDYRLVSTAARVEPSDLPRHDRQRESVREYANYSLSLEEPRQPTPAPELHAATGWALVLGLALALLLLSFGVRAVQVGGGTSAAPSPRRVSFEMQQAHAPGESAATAIPARSLEDARRTFRAERCPNGHAWGAEAEALGPVVLGERRLTPLRRRCTTCNADHTLYFELAAPPPASNES